MTSPVEQLKRAGEQIKKAKAILNRANERHYIIGRIVSRGSRKVLYN